MKNENINTNFDDLKKELTTYNSNLINQQQKIGAEIAVEKLTDSSMFEQLSFLDAQDKKIALKLLSIKSILSNPPQFLEDDEKRLFVSIAAKVGIVQKEFMNICKSTDGKLLNTIEGIFANPQLTLNDNSKKEEKLIKLKR